VRYGRRGGDSLLSTHIYIYMGWGGCMLGGCVVCGVMCGGGVRMQGIVFVFARRFLDL
jgi:hypothetical protein